MIIHRKKKVGNKFRIGYIEGVLRHLLGASRVGMF